MAALEGESALPALCRASAFHWSQGELRRALVVRTKDGAASALARVTDPLVPSVTAPRTLFVFCAAAAEGPNNPGIKPLRADANFKPSNPPPAQCPAVSSSFFLPFSPLAARIAREVVASEIPRA